MPNHHNSSSHHHNLHHSNTSSRTRTRERTSRYSPAPSKPPSPSHSNPRPNPSARVIPDATLNPSSQPYGRYNYLNFSPDPNVWRSPDFHVIASEIALANTTLPNSLTTDPLRIPQALSRKTPADVRHVLDYIHDAFKDSSLSFLPRLSVSHVLAALSSEAAFMFVHAHERHLALHTLIKSRRERTDAECSKDVLHRECQHLAARIEDERVLRVQASDDRLHREQVRDDIRARLDTETHAVDSLRSRVERARMDQLETRRRLDRIRLKVGALRGEMVVPTVDHLGIPHMPPHVDHGPQMNILPWKPIAVPRDETVVDFDSEGETDADEEAMEHRLLQNRLAMVVQESVEWSATLRAEQQRHHLVLRAKAQLEDELGRLRQSGGRVAGPPPARTIGKADAKMATSRVRQAVKAAISMAVPEVSPSVRAPSVRKSRKMRKPCRALTPDV